MLQYIFHCCCSCVCVCWCDFLPFWLRIFFDESKIRLVKHTKQKSSIIFGENSTKIKNTQQIQGKFHGFKFISIDAFFPVAFNFCIFIIIIKTTLNKRGNFLHFPFSFQRILYFFFMLFKGLHKLSLNMANMWNNAIQLS